MVLILLALFTKAFASSICLYEPPFKRGQTHRIIQGFQGKYSHKPPLQYGVDFEMPIGTLIFSSRAGIISELKMDSDEGGASKKFFHKANKIIIDHGHNEFSLYAHLKKGSARVKLGQKIKSGFPIARSGCTGWCDGPHLHFEVFKKDLSGSRVSKKFKFKSSSGCSVPKLGSQITNKLVK